jgi:hypothetical protein
MNNHAPFTLKKEQEQNWQGIDSGPEGINQDQSSQFDSRLRNKYLRYRSSRTRCSSHQK